MVPGIRPNRDDGTRHRTASRDPDRRNNCRSRRAAHQQSFLANQANRHCERLFITHAFGRINRAQVENSGRLAPANALNSVPGAKVWVSRVYEVRESRTDRSAKTILASGGVSSEMPPETGDRAPCAKPAHKRADLHSVLRNDHRPGSLFMNAGVRGIANLVSEESPAFGGELLRDPPVVAWVVRWCVRDNDDFRAECREHCRLIDGHLLRHHARELVSANRRNQRQPNASVPGGCFHSVYRVEACPAALHR